MHVTIDTNGTLTGTTIKDGETGEVLGLAKSLSVTISKNGNLERLSLTWDDSGAAKRKATKQEKAAAEDTLAQPE